MSAKKHIKKSKKLIGKLFLSQLGLSAHHGDLKLHRNSSSFSLSLLR
jgi:hypothetical protein